MSLAMWYVEVDKMGYGAYGIALADAMRAQGIEIERFHPNDPIPKTSTALWIAQPGHSLGKWEHQFAAVGTMWESTKLPESYVESIDMWDAVIVPNTFNGEQFAHFHDNVHVVPLGVDARVWTPAPRPVSDRITFLVCGAGARKGTDLAFKAFCDAFPYPHRMDPQPWLIQKNHKEKDMAAMNVRTIGEKIPLEDLVALYHSAHVYVQPSRGEGWGLQPHQALTTGMPAILSDIPGHRDYADGAEGAMLVPTSLDKAGYFMYGEAGDWWEPNYDYLVDAFRDAYTNYSLWHYKAQRDAPRIATEFSSARMARETIEALGGPDAIAAPYRGSDKTLHKPDVADRFISRTIRRFWTRVSRHVQPCEIGPRAYEFFPGIDYWTYADVKRVLWEAGYIDPMCMKSYNAELGDFSKGLTDEEALRRGLPSGCIGAEVTLIAPYTGAASTAMASHKLGEP